MKKRNEIRIEITLDKPFAWVTFYETVHGEAIEQVTCEPERVSSVIGAHLADMMRGGVK